MYPKALYDSLCRLTRFYWIEPYYRIYRETGNGARGSQVQRIGWVSIKWLWSVCV
ncbi:hypothetical protein QPD63_09470 [Clostridioides difficile]|nr:hypothetical protein [Clostridioides difficile]